MINFKFKKVLTSLLASFAMSKNKNSEASRLIVRTQKNKTSKIEVEVKVGGNRKKGLDKIWWDRQ